MATLTHVSREEDSQSENFLLKEALKSPDYVQTLMALSMDDAQSEEVQLKSVLILKRVLGFKRDELEGNQEEFFRANCLECLLVCKNMKVGRNFAVVLYNAMLKYYPAHWPGLDAQMIGLFQSVESVEKLFWILTAFYNLSKVREHSIDDEEIFLKNQSINAVFPKIEDFLVNLMNNPLTKQSALILRLISKIFCKSVRYNLPLYLTNNDKNDLWMGIIGRALQLAVPEGELTEDLWSVKKWLSRALVVYFRKYAQLNNPQAEEFEKQFALQFSQKFCLPLIGTFTECLTTFRRGFSDKKEDKFALNVMRCLTHSIRNKLLNKNVTRRFLEFARDYVIPSLKFNQADEDVYRDDPNEYFKRNDDFLSSVTYREGALNFLAYLFEQNPQYFVDLFSTHFADPKLDPVAREVFYHVLEKCFDTFRGESKHAQFVNWVFTDCLAKDLQTQFGFLQMRCCRVVYRYVAHTLPVAALQEIYKPICSLMEHDDLPVRCCAALAFNSLLSKKEMTQLVRPYLKDILVIFVKLIRKIENDTLINSLKNVFTKFRDELGPYTEDLCGTIVDICVTMYKKNHESEKNDIEIDEFAFISAISSIEYLVEITTDQTLLAKVMESVFPLVRLVFNDMNLESFEECVGLVSTLCAKLSSSLHPRVLQIFQYFLYGMGNLALVQAKVAQGFVSSNPLFENILGKEEENFIEFTSSISTLFRNVIYHNWMFIYKEKDDLGNNYLELLYRGINNSIDCRMELIDSSNKVCLSMLLSTLVVTAQKYSPEVLANSSLIANSIELVMKIINEAQNDLDEESNMKVYQNCLLHNIGICLVANPQKTVSFLESKNLVSIVSDNLIGKFSQLMTYRTLRTYFMGVCTLIMNRSVVTSPELTALLSNPDILVYFNRILIKLSMLKELNSFVDDNELDEFPEDNDDGEIDSEIEKMLSKFQKDPALENLEQELCRTDMEYIMHVEVLMAFDFDICNELIYEIDELAIFKNLINKESSERSALFQGYVSGTSEAMKLNVQKVIG